MDLAFPLLGHVWCNYKSYQIHIFILYIITMDLIFPLLGHDICRNSKPSVGIV